jgi:putative FmdB family regulatory protein
MPTYEYRCKDCGEHLEVVQAFTDDALTECPTCKGQLRKVFGNIGITFKGSGFYKTDSRSKKSASKTDSKSSDTKSDTSSSEKSDSKTDSKSETKSDSKSEGKSETKKDTSPSKSSSDAKSA